MHQQLLRPRGNGFLYRRHGGFPAGTVGTGLGSDVPEEDTRIEVDRGDKYRQAEGFAREEGGGITTPGVYEFLRAGECREWLRSIMVE